MVIDIWECVTESTNESLPVCTHAATQKFITHRDTCRYNVTRVCHLYWIFKHIMSALSHCDKITVPFVLDPQNEIDIQTG